MVSLLIGVQTVCIGVSTFLAYRSTRQFRTSSMKLISKDKKFKHYRAGGF